MRLHNEIVVVVRSSSSGSGGEVGVQNNQGVAVESEGATCVFVEGKEVPLIVQKSDGGYGYASTDMAAIKQRLNDEKADKVFSVSDATTAGENGETIGLIRSVAYRVAEA